ncbi:MAG: hypothetical protein EXQ74_03855 [Thermoleophilia bacterium]|nr:hypothetical protein [Thermoleophilia bacterium]
MSSILLLVIAIVAPWVVHLVSPRQRLVAVVAAVAVLLLYGVFTGNPLVMWQLWVGVIIGIGSVVLWLNMASGTRSRRRWEDEEEAEPTGEL